MTVNPSTPYSRDLGDELRQLRDKYTVFNGTQMSEVLGWDQSKVSNLENGKVRASEIDLVQYLTRCGRDREFVEAFLDRFRNAFDDYFVQVHSNLRTMALAEASATKITSYDMVAIPGLLQTEDYARALFNQVGKSPQDEIEAEVRGRMQRQVILERADRPEALFYVHEDALRRPVGNDKIMEAQLRRLMFKTHALRIVPRASGAAGAFGGTHILWRYERNMPVIYSETALTRVFAQASEAVKQGEWLFGQLDRVAMTEGQSRSLLMSYISAPRKDPHALGSHVA